MLFTPNNSLKELLGVCSFREILIAFEVLNLFGFNNVNSYYWVTDIYNTQYAVPNYLTGRQFNLKLQLKF